MSESLPPTDALLRALDVRFAARRSSAAAQRAPARPDPHLSAAAVLHVFDPARLRPYGTGEDSAARDALTTLIDASAPAIGWRHAGLRTLRPEPRQVCLRALGSREALRAALEANPGRERTTVQRLFERWLDGDDFELDRMTYAELENLRQLYDWGLDTFAGLPPRQLVERARVKRSAVAVFEHLVDKNFTGRHQELQVLRGHVRQDGPGAHEPLMLYGPGGVGKTALVGRFLIDHVEEAGRGWLPFAYLPFDSETLDVREPFTLLLEITRQLTNQGDPSAGPAAHRSSLAQVADQFRATVEKYRDRRGSLQRRAGDHIERVGRIRSLSAAESELYEEFTRLLAAVTVSAGLERGIATTPMLLVFDTFEEVVYRAAEDLLGFWEMVGFLLAKRPELRIVIAGRGRPAVPRGKWPRRMEIPLGELDEQDAVALLTRLGVRDHAARVIAQQVGGNPLSIRLAARVSREESSGRSGISGLGPQAAHGISAELVRGLLHRRLLEHIHDHDARSLAHPGMVLRRVTPDVIQNVLAPACDLVGIDGERSRRLFDELRREQDLVSLERDGSLWYREEVRRPMLELLAHDKPAQVRRIHQFAITHYGTLTGPANRAEELYHRMMLRQSAAELDDRWIPGIERFIASAVEELPPAQRRWLAGRMSIELPPEIYQLAAVGEWERLIGHKAMEVVRFGGPNRVLDLLAEREERTPESPLFAIEARALLDLGRPPAAAALLDRALEHFPVLGNPGRLAEILWLRAQVATAEGNTAASLTFLDRLREVAIQLPSALALVQALTEILGVLQQHDLPEDQQARIGPVRHALSEALLRLTEAEVSKERSLVRLALVCLGPNYPGVLAPLARLVIDDLAYLARRGLVDLTPAIGPVLDSLTAELPRLPRYLPLSDLRYLAKDGATSVLTDVLYAVIDELSIRTQPIGPDQADRGPAQPFADALLALLCTEDATLSSSSLAGIDDYREPWELQFTPEVAS